MSRKIEVDIFIPCFIDQVYPETGFNMVKVLEALGCKVHYNPAQTCCGQPAFNAGFFEEAREVATKLTDELSLNKRYIVTPSASCAGMIRNNYEKLLEETSSLYHYRKLQKNIYEFSDFLVNILKVHKVPGAKLDAKVTYHDACSALREYGIKEAPRLLLRNVEGLQLKEMEDAETCCGFGGTFAVKYEAISSGMAEQKVENAVATGAEVIVSTDASCLMHISGFSTKKGESIKVMHLADVLASGW
ncbi:(Fe-S)-binding protein [Cytophagaceae bacterium ABcell3]|nr:(Fe-S)-binding protein [Cytophagaceae bacterium ABcell3]